jgi:hypothetical protein
MHQAKISLRYSLILQEGENGCWMAALRGPCPQQDDCISSEDLGDAKRNAYAFAINHLMSKGLKEPGVVTQDELKWFTVSK